MNRKLLIQVTAPAVLIGLLLFAACLAGAWYVYRLQRNLATVLTENVASQQAAQTLEIRGRELQYHSFLYLMNPTPARRERINQDHAHLESALQQAQETARTPEQQQWVDEIKQNYERYNRDTDELMTKVAAGTSIPELVKFADAHPLQRVVEPSQQLLDLNKRMLESISQESQHVARQAQRTMFMLGLVGPAGGLIAGFGIARGLSRSIYQLSVRVRDMAQSLDQDVASVQLRADGDLQTLDRQLQHVLRRVEEVTERQQRHQREMLRAEQLAAVGQLAAGVAHEIRNPLTAVKMLIEAALRPENRKPLQLADLRVIHGEIVRLEHTVQGLLDFARLPAPQRCDCDLRDVLAEAVNLARVRASQQKVDLAVDQPLTRVPADVDPNQLRTVLVNLLLNALDAMPQGGRLEARLQGSTTTGIRLTVADTGSGIAPDLAGRLFTPFTTTKATGTGLGLSISRRIVEEHGGRLVAVNRLEGGACFTITLPPPATSA